MNVGFANEADFQLDFTDRRC